MRCNRKRLVSMPRERAAVHCCRTRAGASTSCAAEPNRLYCEAEAFGKAATPTVLQILSESAELSDLKRRIRLVRQRKLSLDLGFQVLPLLIRFFNMRR